MALRRSFSAEFYVILVFLFKILYENGWSAGGIIGISLIDESTTTASANSASLEQDCIGIGTTFLEKRATSTKIMFMTYEYLVHEMLQDPLLTKFRVLVISIACLRNSQTDIILSLLKKILKNRPGLKLIIISSSSENTFLKDYFNVNPAKNPIKTSCIISVKEQLHPIHVYYQFKQSPDYRNDLLKTVLKICEKYTFGNILAFLPSYDDIRYCINWINEEKTQRNRKIIPIDGSKTKNLTNVLQTIDQMYNVIFVNNIGNELDYIPNVKYVIDCGIIYLNVFDLNLQADRIIKVPISKSIARDRAELAGTLTQGKVFRLYTEEVYTGLPDNMPAEICRQEFSPSLLQLKTLGINNFTKFDFPVVPPANIILSGVERLYALGIIDEVGNLTKPLGYFVSELPLDPFRGRMLFTSTMLECSEEILTIIAMQEMQPFFANMTTSAKARRNFEATEGDLITMLNIFTAFRENGKSKEFCSPYALAYSKLVKMSLYRDKLQKYLETKLNIKLSSSKGNIDNICKSITSGYFLNAAYLEHSGAYKKINGGSVVAIDNSSSLYNSPPKQFIICADLETKKNKIFAKNVTETKREWLSEVAGHYFKKISIA